MVLVPRLRREWRGNAAAERRRGWAYAAKKGWATWGVLLVVLSLGLVTTDVALAAAGDITTVAGGGTSGLR